MDAAGRRCHAGAIARGSILGQPSRNRGAIAQGSRPDEERTESTKTQSGATGILATTSWNSREFAENPSLHAQRGTAFGPAEGRPRTVMPTLRSWLAWNQSGSHPEVAAAEEGSG